MRVVVVGGGIAGLAAARTVRRYALDANQDVEVSLLEASERLGGKIWTERIDGLPLEWGPDSFVSAKPRGRDLAEELGLAGDLVAPDAPARRTYLLTRGGLVVLPRGLVMGVPTGPRALADAARSGLVSARGAA